MRAVLYVPYSNGDARNGFKYDKEISQKEYANAMVEYYNQHKDGIDSVFQSKGLGRYISVNPFKVYKSLYLEYRCYNYDTALIYVENMEREALPEQMPEVDLCRAFVYLSGGLFKEASDILDGWEERYSAELTRDLMLRYCVLYARLLWDMADQGI